MKNSKYGGLLSLRGCLAILQTLMILLLKPKKNSNIQQNPMPTFRQKKKQKIDNYVFLGRREQFVTLPLWVIDEFPIICKNKKK
jgi:hypothetical protein